MNVPTITNTAAPRALEKAWRWRERLAKTLLLRSLQDLQHGQIRLSDASGEILLGRTTPLFPTMISVRVHEPRFYSELVFGSSIAAGETFMDGAWSCSDLVALLRLTLRNPGVFAGMDGPWSLLARSLHRVQHRLRGNTQTNSRRNISQHYDLGNAFYRLFLDETMMYSSGIFETPETPLEDASREKLERVCRKLRLTPTDTLVEIGTGWGGLALHAAREFGCSVVTTTISERQKELAQQRVRDAQLTDRVTVLSQDYRDLEGLYSKLVSIEMIESVGHEYLDSFFATCSRLLKADGSMLVQAIVIGAQQYERYRRSADFIQRYVFPGGCLPSVARMCDCVARKTDLRVIHLEDFTEDYALTLAHWRTRFLANLDAVRALGYGEAFIRRWEYYLCYCEAGFRERNIGLVQMVLAKPGYR
jgi:cyclopropane-fatty-acyl-phospholipid synthase